MIWHDDAACGGVVFGVDTTSPFLGDSGVGWASFGGWFETPADTISSEVSFVLAAGVSPDFMANLDDLLVIEMLFCDGFETGDNSGWSAVVP